MAIDYLEIRDAQRDIIGYIDTAISVIWHSVYFGVGDFEIYAQATGNHISLLETGNYVTRLDNSEIGIIEKVEISKTLQDGDVITASGRFAKSILDRRLIYQLSGKTNKATVLRGNVETNVRNVVASNAINCSFDSKRNIPILELGPHAGTTAIIVDENGNPADRQVSYDNLLTFTDELLEEYFLGSTVYFNHETKKLQYCVYEGVDRSVDNTNGLTPVIVSKEFDNLVSSYYTHDTAQEKNVALIGGEGEGLDRFYSLLAGNESALLRRELWVDGASINKKYKDDQDVEHTYTDSQYKGLLNNLGKQKLSELNDVESFSGTINIDYGQYVLGRDYNLGDVVTVQDNSINKYANVRILEITEVQDGSGYNVDIEYK